MEQLNNLISQTFGDDVVKKWNTKDFQSKVKAILKAKKVKKEKDPSKPLSPYIKFCVSEREAVKEKFPELSFKEITSKMGQLWNEYKEHNPEYLEREYGYVKKEAKAQKPKKVKKTKNTE